jgi:hypothetical protein
VKKLLAFAAAISLALAPGAQAYYNDSLPLCKSAVANTAPADTNEDILAICTVPAGAMGSNGVLRITTSWSLSGNANAKTLNLRFSGISGAQYVNFAAANFSGGMTTTLIANRGATNSQAGASFTVFTAAPVVTYVGQVSSVNTAAVTTVVITCQKATGSDTCTLESYLVELIGGGT